MYQGLLTVMLFSLTLDCIPAVDKELWKEIISQNNTKTQLALLETEGLRK